ncbi:hypothetical protein VaNZ11_010040 [Volvox africanus]|uniref:O-fucosyltransferase family protein n=1 Tax=Volvox africanus TaxID=51714 RepID=A0ABQ5S8P1_9CHLO|nr:hypothetical protein VaNZ11_010040 [Volvox africanus]
MLEIELEGMAPGVFVHTCVLVMIILTMSPSYQGLALDSVSSSSRNTSAENLLKQCYNSQFESSGSRFSEYMDGKPTRSLYLHRVWWSTRRAEFPISFFTQADLQRLRALQEQCKSLPGGTVVAAIWLPLGSTIGPRGNDAAADAEAAKLGPGLSARHIPTVKNATAILDNVFAQNEAASNTSCVLRLLLLYEIVFDEALGLLMPINTMRNAAMMATDSQLVAMVDVDLSANKDLAASVMRSPERVAEMILLAEKQHMAWIMPAFDVSPSVPPPMRNYVADEALAVSREEKSRLRDMWTKYRLIFPFAMERGYTRGHNATKYEEWFVSQSHYPVYYEEGYEPWFMASRFLVPFFDARFRGYYMNKLVAARNTLLLANMRVLPDVWIVHRPHELQVSNYGWLEAQKTLQKKHHTEKMVLDQAGGNEQFLRELTPALGHPLLSVCEPILYNGTSKSARDAFFERNIYFYKSAVSQMETRNYTPVADVAADNCRKVLPWWSRRAS